jgi:hypothetical protein
LNGEPQSSPVTNPAAATAPVANHREGADLWAHRAAVLLFVLLCAGAGVTLVVLPWTLQWTDNSLLLRFPHLRPIVTNGFFRGVCSGLGILDLWIGFSEAVQYHEEKPPQK